VLRIAQGALAGIAAGIVTGIGARIAMRLVAVGVADGVGVRPEFTIEGTVAIIASGAIAGVPFGAAYALVERRLPHPARARGLMYAALVLVFFGPLFFATEEFFSRGRIALFTLVFLVFGIAIGAALPLVERVAPRIPSLLRRLLVAAAVGTGALVLAGFGGIAGEAFERHGAGIAAFAIPWVTLAVLAAPALRARLARPQVAQ
jgi:hypothetical protein